MVIQWGDGVVESSLGNGEGRLQHGEQPAPQGSQDPPAHAPLAVDDVDPQDTAVEELDEGDGEEETGDTVPDAGDLGDLREEVTPEEVVQVGDVHLGEGRPDAQHSS